mgnify:CR=1 FL=1
MQQKLFAIKLKVFLDVFLPPVKFWYHKDLPRFGHFSSVQDTIHNILLYDDLSEDPEAGLLTPLDLANFL